MSIINPRCGHKMVSGAGKPHGHYPGRPVMFCPQGDCDQWLVEFPARYLAWRLIASQWWAAVVQQARAALGWRREPL